MQKKSIAAIRTNFKRLAAFVMTATMLFLCICAAPFAPFTVEAVFGETNHGIDPNVVFKKGNGIYLGTYTHSLPAGFSGNELLEQESSPNPILWEVNEIFEDGNTTKVALTSRYVLNFMTKDEIETALFEFEDYFSPAEQSIIESSVYLLDNADVRHFQNETSYYGLNFRKAYLKGGTSPVNWLIGSGGGDSYGYVETDGQIIGNIDIYQGTVGAGTAEYGFRPSITIGVDKIVYAEIVSSSPNSYSGIAENYRLTIVDDMPFSGYNLELYNLQLDDLTVTDEVLEVNINGTLNLTAESARNAYDNCEINYKIIDNIVDTSGESITLRNNIVKYDSASGSPNTDGTNNLAIRSSGLKAGQYAVYLWIQIREPKNSFVASDPIIFELKVTDPNSNEQQDYFNSIPPVSDFGVVVDYYNEVIRIVSADDLAGKSYLEAATYDQAEAYKLQAKDYYKNRGDKVAFMYCLKATDTSSMREDKRIKAYLSEKWYPMYGDTIDIEKALPKNSKSSKGYYVAIRKVDDVFDLKNGYSTRQIVPLKPRNSDSQFKKMLDYDSDKQLFSLSSGSDLKVLYRMNYFPTPISATMSVDITDTSKNIKVPADIFPMGGVLYISTMPIMEDGTVIYAASKQIKVSVPKRQTVPAVKLDKSSGKLKSLKKSTTEYSYDGINWTTYNGDSSIDAENIMTNFPHMTIDGDNYYLYFRTKSTAKNPASEIKTLEIPRNLVNP